MARILHMSDSHLGYRQYGLRARERDMFISFVRAMRIARDRDVDFIVHTGDLFDSVRPPNEILLKVARVIEGVQIPFICIPGNHDYSRSLDATPLLVLESEIKGALKKEREEVELFYPLGAKRALEGVSDIFLDNFGVNVVGIRYLYPTERELWPEVARVAEKFRVDGFPNILLLHQEYENVMGKRAPGISLESLPDGYDFILMGHYHSATEPTKKSKGIIYYAGSTEVCDADDEDLEKKVFIIDTDTMEVESVPLKTRPFVVVASREDLKNLDYSGRPVVVLLDRDLEPLVDRERCLYVHASRRGMERVFTPSDLDDGETWDDEAVLREVFSEKEDSELLVQTAMEIVSSLDGIEGSAVVEETRAIAKKALRRLENAG